MTTWPKLSEDYTSNGYTVSIMSDTEDMANFGEVLRNGLSHSFSRDVYAGECARGGKQAFKIIHDGEIVAGGEVYVSGGKVFPAFVRGYANKEYPQGTEFHNVVVEYTNAVNDGRVKLLVGIGKNGFTDLPKEDVVPMEISSWEQVVKVAEEKGVSPFEALISDVRAPQEDEGVKFSQEKVNLGEVITWTALTAPYTTRNGLTVKCLTSNEELHAIGEVMENSFMLYPNSYAYACADGVVQYAIVENDGEALAVVELQAVSGHVLPASLVAPHETVPSEEVKKAVSEYIIAINGRRIEANEEFINANRADGAELTVEIGKGVVGLNANLYPRLISPERDGYSQAQAFGLGYNEDEDEDVMVNDEPWVALTESYKAPNGYTVEVVTNVEDLINMGVALNNALQDHRYADSYAGNCLKGKCQIVRILNADGALDSNALLTVKDGVVYPEFNRTLNNVDASTASNKALEVYLEKVNNRDIEVLMEIGDSGFEEKPTPNLSM